MRCPNQSRRNSAFGVRIGRNGIVQRRRRFWCHRSFEQIVYLFARCKLDRITTKQVQDRSFLFSSRNLMAASSKPAGFVTSDDRNWCAGTSYASDRAIASVSSCRAVKFDAFRGEDFSRSNMRWSLRGILGGILLSVRFAEGIGQV